MSAPRWARHVREKLKDAEDWARASSFGVVDGLTTNGLILFGTALQGKSPQEIAAAGITGLIAAPFAQGAGERLSVRIHNLVVARKAEQEAGTDGRPPRQNSPTTAAVAAWVAAFSGAAAPVVPYVAGQSNPLWALGVGATGLAVAGFASTKVTGLRWWQGVKEYLSTGGAVGAGTYLAENAGTVARHPVLAAATVAGATSAAVVRHRWRRRRAERAARTTGASRAGKPEGSRTNRASRVREGGRDRSKGGRGHRLRSPRAMTDTKTTAKQERRQGHAR